MALVTTMLTVMAMLGGIAALLWLSTVIEARRLGPAGLQVSPLASAEAAPMDAAVEAAVGADVQAVEAVVPTAA